MPRTTQNSYLVQQLLHARIVGATVVSVGANPDGCVTLTLRRRDGSLSEVTAWADEEGNGPGWLDVN